MQVEVGIEVTVSRQVEATQQTTSKHNQGSSSSNPQAPTYNPPSAFDKVKGKCIRCLESGRTWSQ